uniref:Arylsulfatase 4 n=1 Tax=Phyllotreta armoraciae TaxID=1553667 RepID=A0A384WD97_9CUCU|nr:arylsulfatase 4 [Phyllotreta armoraciae]
MWRSWFVFVILVESGLMETKNPSPNIIVIMADDMGFNDVSFHGSSEIPTPNIDALAYNGVILNSHYAQSLCTPSRSAFLTGKYPIHSGMQHIVILESEPWGLPLNETLLPELLKNKGYATHAIGKWHLGFFKKEYTPTFRGFDTHFGYWQGLQDYYTHMTKATYSDEIGYDMRRNLEVDYEAKGKYSTTLFTEEAVKLIHQHNTSKPMFLYMAHLAPHAGNPSEPLQAPDEEVYKFAHIADPERRVYAAMVSMLDKSVGDVVKALRDRRMLQNSVILFLSDNGAAPEGVHANRGSNYPLRGMKHSAWEGGTRNIAAIWSPLIKKSRRVSNHLMHISDWLPTFSSIAGLDSSQIPKIDGLDMWKSISEDDTSPRTEILYNIDDPGRWGGVRQGNWKYIYGSTSNGVKDKWYPSNEVRSYDIDQVLSSKTAISLAGLITQKTIKNKHSNSPHEDLRIINERDVQDLRAKATIFCEDVEDQLEEFKCDLLKSPCLFNIYDDPCERVNLAERRPNIVHNLEQLLLEYRKDMVPALNQPEDPAADPVFWNNTWTSWRDCQNVVKRKINGTFSSVSTMNVALIACSCVVVLLMALGLANLADKERLKEEKRKAQSLISGNTVSC